jgi:hypothetical protein
MILGIDPSGNFDEGKGTTGMCLLEPGTTNITETIEVKATEHSNPYSYWQDNIWQIEPWYTVSMEDYLLYADKSSSQINSKFETVQLIGLIKYFCWENDVPLYMRNAGQVKKRWDNDILEHKGYIVKYSKRRWATAYEPDKPISRHVLDAIRHAVHYDLLESKKED